MGGLRRWRILITVFVIWVLFCWYVWGPRPDPAAAGGGVDSSQPLPGSVPLVKGPPSQPQPPPEGAITGELRFKKHPDRFHVESLVAIPTGVPDKPVPRVQAAKPGETDEARKTRLHRLEAVKESFLHSWEGYRDHAWMHDEVTPLTGKSGDPFGGWAATLVDSLDSLWILGFKDEFEKAAAACGKIDFSTSASRVINVFETTIRYLGGFLAAYELSEKKYSVLLKKATEVGELLMGAFDTPNRLPITRWDWKEYVRGAQQIAGSQTIVSELGSLTLEFTKLSELTGDMRYYDAVKRISDVFELSQDQTLLPGMWPIIVDAAAPSFHTFKGFTLGGMADSLYEYFPKFYLLLDGRLEQPRKMYEKFIDAAKSHVFWRVLNPDNHDLLIAGDVDAGSEDGKPVLRYKHQGQHLTCFAGGMVGLASRVFDRPDDLDVAARLTMGCVWAYNASQHGICPEVFSFVPCGHLNGTVDGTSSSSSAPAGEKREEKKKGEEPCKWEEAKWRAAVGRRWGTKSAEDEGSGRDGLATLEKQIDAAIQGERLQPGFVSVEDRRYILRPEAIESVFVMYRLTADPAWMDAAWEMFQRIEKVSRTPVAAAAISDVTASKPVAVDSMESFWLAETLKYFALVFMDWDVVSLDEWVLNTEAHPLRVMKEK